MKTKLSEYSSAAPLVSVMIPAYNASSFISSALRSIQTQTFKDFEVIVVDDGSEDNTGEIARGFCKRDARFRLLEQENRGIVRSLNAAIEEARGVYLMRMDADDMSHPQRLELQLSYLEKNPDIGIVGSAAYQFNAETEWAVTYPPSDPEARSMLLFRPPFCHPAVLLRASILREHQVRYDNAFSSAEDFKLWSDLSAHTKFGNMRRKLLWYRVHDGQMTSRKRQEQEGFARTVCSLQLARLGVVATDDELELHRSIAFCRPVKDESSAEQVVQWLDIISDANMVADYVSVNEFAKYLANIWAGILHKSTPYWRSSKKLLGQPSFWSHLAPRDRFMRRSRFLVKEAASRLNLGLRVKRDSGS